MQCRHCTGRPCKKRELETLQWHHYYYLISSHIAINLLAWNWFAMHPPLQGHSSFSLSVLHSIHTSLFATHCLPHQTPYTVLSPISYIHTYIVKIMWLTLHLRACSVVSDAYNSDQKGMLYWCSFRMWCFSLIAMGKRIKWSFTQLKNSDADIYSHNKSCSFLHSCRTIKDL